MQAAEQFAKQREDGEMPPLPALPGTTPKTIVKGGSGNAKDNAKYRAAWIIESDEEDDGEDDEDDDDSMIAEEDEDDEELMLEGHGGEGDLEVEGAIDNYERMKAVAFANQQPSDAASEMPFEDVDDAQAEAAYLAYQEQRRREREERDDAEFLTKSILLSRLLLANDSLVTADSSPSAPLHGTLMRTCLATMPRSSNSKTSTRPDVVLKELRCSMVSNLDSGLPFGSKPFLKLQPSERGPATSNCPKSTALYPLCSSLASSRTQEIGDQLHRHP